MSKRKRRWGRVHQLIATIRDDYPKYGTDIAKHLVEPKSSWASGIDKSLNQKLVEEKIEHDAHIKNDVYHREYLIKIV